MKWRTLEAILNKPVDLNDNIRERLASHLERIEAPISIVEVSSTRVSPLDPHVLREAQESVKLQQRSRLEEEERKLAIARKNSELELKNMDLEASLAAWARSADAVQNAKSELERLMIAGYVPQSRMGVDLLARKELAEIEAGMNEARGALRGVLAVLAREVRDEHLLHIIQEQSEKESAKALQTLKEHFSGNEEETPALSSGEEEKG